MSRLKKVVALCALLGLCATGFLLAGSISSCKKTAAAPDAGALRPGPPVAKPGAKPDMRLTAPIRRKPRCLYPPGAVYIKFAELMFKGQHPAAFGRLALLLRKYPESSLLRVRAASVLMRAGTPYPARAQKLYREALELEKSKGCILSARYRWLALNGLGSTHMDLKDHVGALPWLRLAVKQWPNSAATRYNLACALCVVGQVDACYKELVATLATCASGKAPVVEKENKPAYHYAKLSQTDADLVRARADPRYEAMIRPYLMAGINTSPPR